MAKTKKPILLIGGAVAFIAAMLGATAVGMYVVGPVYVEVPRDVIVEVPACDTMVNANDAAKQLRARIVTGIKLTECDIQQFDHVVSFIDDFEREFDSRAACESDLTECEWGWWDETDCRRYQEASRFEAAIDAIYSCAEASR